MLKENNNENNIVLDSFTTKMINAIQTANDLIAKRQYDVKKIAHLLSDALDGNLMLLSEKNLKEEGKTDALITNLVRLWHAYSEHIFIIGFCN